MSNENEKIQGDGPDFEGHKLEDQKIEQKLERASDDTSEPDFEGHKFELKVEPKVEP